MQNLLQSHEIRFGDAFEKLIEEYLKENNFIILDNRFTDKGGDKLNIDQFFKKNNHYYFIEQKVRDDHDSTKKRGQIDNFEKKLEVIIDKFGDDNLKGFFYFIDPDLIKNKNFYEEELEKMSTDYGVKLINCYGKQLFKKLDLDHIWEEIITYLKKWRDELPDTPEINFDKEAEYSFNEIKDLSPSIFRKLFSNDELFEQIVKTIFPENKVLKMLINYFNNKNTKIYKTLTELIEYRIKNAT